MVDIKDKNQPIKFDVVDFSRVELLLLNRPAHPLTGAMWSIKFDFDTIFCSESFSPENSDDRMYYEYQTFHQPCRFIRDSPNNDAGDIDRCPPRLNKPCNVGH